jgi:hypothetical protein
VINKASWRTGVKKRHPEKSREFTEKGSEVARRRDISVVNFFKKSLDKFGSMSAYTHHAQET